MKKCPYCAEEIQDQAQICRYCGKELSAPAQTKTNQVGTWSVIILLVLIAVIGWIIVNGISNRQKALDALESIQQPSSPKAQYRRVTYVVQGTASEVSLTYENEQGNTEQRDVRLPWELRLSVPAGQFLYISAQNQGTGGSVICEIWIDGLKTEEARSQGAYKIASCSTTAR